MNEKKYRFNTRALHAGHEPDETTLSRAVPIYRTSSYVFKDSEHAANLFAIKELGNIYTRIMNPTQAILEERMASLEGGAASLALASGTSAIFNSIINICEHGDEVASSNQLYGGTFTMFHDILPQFNIKVRFFDPTRPNTLKEVINEKTKAVFTETIGNPKCDFADLSGLAEISHDAQLPFLVDSTFTTPYLLRPIEYGADIVIHSLTKWIGGHGTGIGGVVVDSGKFNWNQKKFRLYTEPDPSYHSMRFATDLGELNPIAFALRMRLVPLRNLGACISPDNAWLFLQGLETLSLRMERHCENALAVAEYLKKHPRVSWVRYPGLKDDPAHSLASRYLKKGYGSVVVFGVKGGKSAGEKLINSVQLFSHLANVGDAKSLILHPASTTHAQVPEKDLEAGGITPDMLRLSIGIEDVQDIIEDLEQALAKV